MHDLRGHNFDGVTRSDDFKTVDGTIRSDDFKTL